MAVTMLWQYFVVHLVPALSTRQWTDIRSGLALARQSTFTGFPIPAMPLDAQQLALVAAANLDLRRVIGDGHLVFAPLVLLMALSGARGVAPANGPRFTLSLPVSRDRLLFTRLAIGLGGIPLLVLVTVIALKGAILGNGLSYPFGEAVSMAAPWLVACWSVFAVAIWLRTIFADLWIPSLLALLAAWLVYAIESGFSDATAPTDVVINAAIGLAALGAARWNFNRKDF